MRALFRGLVDHKTLAIVTNLVNNPAKLFHLRELSSVSNVPIATTSRVVSKLIKHEIINIVVVGKLKLYQINTSHKIKLSHLVEKKKLAIFTALHNNPEKLFHLKSISDSTNVPIATTSRIINEFVNNKICERELVGKLSLYRISQKKLEELRQYV
jgi:DNA-binding MarR family transcriptional regulator